MSATNSDQLRTKEADKPFHAARRMFWIINSEPIFAPPQTDLSHIEFAEKQGWCTPETAHLFAEKHVRGFFLSSEDTPILHFYTGEFRFDESVEEIARQSISKIASLLAMPKNTKIYLGPRDSSINGKQYTIKFLGSVLDFI